LDCIAIIHISKILLLQPLFSKGYNCLTEKIKTHIHEIRDKKKEIAISKNSRFELVTDGMCRHVTKGAELWGKNGGLRRL
jgi:hypothetical protein